MARLTRDWLLLTTELQTVAEVEKGENVFLQDIIVCNPTFQTGAKVEIYVEKKTEDTLDKPSFDPDLSADYATQGTIKGGIPLNGDYVIKAKLSAVASDVSIRTLF